MSEAVFKDAESRMKKSVQALRQELSTIRTGRASSALIEHLPVEHYGTTQPLVQLASISTPEARLIVVQPWDRSAIGPIEKAIQKSELGLNPANDGSVIRVPVPQLSEERRRDLVKVVHKKVEESRVAVRNVRRDALEELKSLEKAKSISQTELKRAQERLQKLTDQHIREVDQVGHAKEQEVMEV